MKTIRAIAATTILLALAGLPTACAEDGTGETNNTATNSRRSPWEEIFGTNSAASPSPTPREEKPTASAFSPATRLLSTDTDVLLPKKNPDDEFDRRPTRKVYGTDNRGDRKLDPDLIIEPSVRDRYEIHETDRYGLARPEPKAVITHGSHDSYEIYKTDRYGQAVDKPHLVIKEGLRSGEYKVYETDRDGAPQDTPSRVIVTDSLGRQKIYRAVRDGRPIGAPSKEQIVE